MTITILLTYEFKIKQKRLSKMSSVGNISSLCTGKVQSTFFKLTNSILKTEMWTKDKTKRLRRKSGYRHLPFKPTICSICTSSNLSEGGSAKFPVRDDEHVSSFGAKGLEPEEYYQALIFWGGGVAVVLDLLQTRKRWISLPFSRLNVLIDINTLKIKNSGFVRKFFWIKN